ncbi:late embryogenis abundant protein 2-like [Carex rostrata]
MARALSSSPLFKTLLSDGISFLAKRRGFAAAVETVRRSPKTEEMEAVTKSVAGKRVADADPIPWVPDSAGYYRPANRVVEVDAAELRATLLRPRT